MEINKQICQSCVESTYYTSQKPRFCMCCGQSFAVFANKTNSIAKAATITVERDEDDEPLYMGSIKPASYYRQKAKKSFEDSSTDDDEKELEDDGSDDRGGDAGLRASAENQVNILDFLGNGPKKSAGVKFSDIIKISEPSPSNDSAAKPVKEKKTPSPKAAGAKRGRPSKKT